MVSDARTYLEQQGINLSSRASDDYVAYIAAQQGFAGSDPVAEVTNPNPVTTTPTAVPTADNTAVSGSDTSAPDVTASGGVVTPPEFLGTTTTTKIVTTQIKQLDNSTYVGTYTDPTTGTTVDVTARQQAVLVEFEKVKAGTSTLTQSQINTLLSQVYTDADAPQNQIDASGQQLQPDSGGGGIADTNPDLGTVVAGADSRAAPAPAPAAAPTAAPVPAPVPAPAPSTAPAPGTSTQPGGTSAGHAESTVAPEVIANPPDLLAEFLESDPNLVLNHVLNKFRDGGASTVFTRWFRGQFDDFWGRYLGYVAEFALNGDIPTLGFVDWISSFDTTTAFFAESAFGRGDPSSRFASFASQSSAS
jgi:hypothetical protein